MKKFLYHGSSKKLIGKKLIPRQAKDVDKSKKQNMFKGVYATDIKKSAIIMSILKSKGVKGSSLDISNSKGIIYLGFPKQKKVYLYILPKEGSKKVSSHQFVFTKPIKPVKIELINIKDYLPLIKIASKKEVNEWRKKYHIK